MSSSPLPERAAPRGDESGETTEAPAPYRIWPEVAAFRKNGTPIMGMIGSTHRRVVVMEAETFKRLVAEHPSLASARFEVAEYVD